MNYREIRSFAAAICAMLLLQFIAPLPWRALDRQASVAFEAGRELARTTTVNCGFHVGRKCGKCELDYDEGFNCPTDPWMREIGWAEYQRGEFHPEFPQFWQPGIDAGLEP